MKRLDLLDLDHFHFGKEFMTRSFQVEKMNNEIYLYNTAARNAAHILQQQNFLNGR